MVFAVRYRIAIPRAVFSNEQRIRDLVDSWNAVYYPERRVQLYRLRARVLHPTRELARLRSFTGVLDEVRLTPHLSGESSRIAGAHAAGKFDAR